MAAEAGPSSGPQSASLQSFRHLYDALEATTPTFPRQVVHARLRQLLPVFQSACEPLQPPSSTSRAKVQSGDVHNGQGAKIELNEALRECCIECSKLLDVDEVLVAVSMRTFIDTEDISHEHLSNASDTVFSPGASRSTQQARKSRRAAKQEITSSLIEAFCVYFMEERLYARRCISALLRIGDDQYHDLNGIANAALDDFADAAYGQKCLSLASKSTRTVLSDTIRDMPRYSSFWAKYNLCEQLALLEIVFLLYYSRLQSSAQHVAAILQLIKSTDFGSTQVNAGYFDAEASHLLECLAGMQVMLAIESLDVESIISGLDFYATPQETKADRKALQYDANVVNDAVDYLRSSTARDVLRAPLMIIWSLYLARIDEACQDWLDSRGSEPLPPHLQKIREALGHENISSDLASVALSDDLNLFATMRGITQSALFRSDYRGSLLLAMAGSSSLALRAVLKGFVLAITELVRPEYVNDYEGLIALWVDTFEHDTRQDRSIFGTEDSGAALCAQFWEVDFPFEQRRSTLTAASRRFPVNFCHLVHLCRALSGSSPDILHTSGECARAATSVFRYLAESATLTYAMPPSPSISLPYEPDEASDATGTTYRATRAIPVFGGFLVVPAGTLGRIVSENDEGPIVLMWDMSENPVSIWRLLRDVLAKFAGILEPIDKSAQRRDISDAAVFVDRAAPVDFALLAAGEDPGRDGEAAAGALNLISSILSASSTLPQLLLEHLQGQDMHQASLSQPNSLSETSPPSLESIAMSILSQALATPNAASSVIIAAYHLLKLLTDTEISELWLPLRSSGILVGKSTGVSLVGSKSNYSGESSSLLAYEISIGKFAGLIALLDFHLALVSDLQRNLLRYTNADMQIRVDVVLRALLFICEAVWPEYQSWKYVRVRQRIEIGTRCIRIFQAILSDKALRRLESPSKQVYDAIESHFVSEAASPLAAHPLLEIILSGEQFITNLSRSGRQIELELARTLVEAALEFAATTVSCRRNLNLARRDRGFLPSFGHIEGAFFGSSMLVAHSQSSDGTKKAGIAKVVFSYSSATQPLEVRRKALRLITEVVGSTVDFGTNYTPTLITHLGALDDVASIISSLVEQATNEEENVGLRRDTWNLLAALVASQSGLAPLIITGRHIATPSPSDQKTNNLDSQNGTGESSDESAVQKAAEMVRSSQNKKNITVASLQVLESALKVLAYAWPHMFEYYAVFSSLRNDAGLWNGLTELAFGTRDICDTVATSIDLVSAEAESECEERVVMAAYKDMCSARAAQIFAADVRLSPSLRHVKTGQAPELSQSLRCAITLLSDHENLRKVVQAVLLVSCDAHRQQDTRERLAQAFPELALDLFTFEARGDDFDLRKSYGSSYVYDLTELRNRLHSLIQGSADQVDNPDMLEEIVPQISLLVANVNLDWTLIDTQTCRLRAFTDLLSALLAPVFDRINRDASLAEKLHMAVSQAWTTGAELTANEGVDAPLLRDIHMLRVSFLAVLQDMAWNLRSKLAADVAKFVIADEIAMAVRVIVHPLFSFESAVRDKMSDHEITFCRDVLQIMLITARRYQQSLSNFDRKKEGEALARQRIQREAESLAIHAISFAQTVLTECLGSLHDIAAHPGGEDARALNLHLLLKSLAILLRDSNFIAVHIWWPKMQATGFLGTAFELYSRAPISSVTVHSDPQVSAITAPRAPTFSAALLEFFLDMASQRCSVEHLALSGIMTALTANTFSSSLDTEKWPCLPARLVQSSAENPLLSYWVSMLQIVVSLLNALSPAQSSILLESEISTFVRMYKPLIDNCIGRPFAQAGHLLLRASAGRLFDYKSLPEETITLRQLEEAEYVFKLYDNLIRVLPDQETPGNTSGQIRQNQYRKTMEEAYVQKATLRLQEAVHLLQHPQELAMLVGGKSEMMLKDKASSEGTRAQRHLVQISASIIESLWHLSRGRDTLCSPENTEWDAKYLIIVPSIGTPLSRPSTIGTLIDLASYTVDSLRAVRGEGGRDEMRALASLLEQTLSLASTQLALVAHARPMSNQTSLLSKDASGIFNDVEAGLGRDIGQSIESGRASVREAASRLESGNVASTNYLDLLLRFHKRWNESSEG